MGYPYFIFKNRISKDYNIIVNKLPPIHSISNKVEHLDIPGRSGYLTIDENKRETIEKEVVITVFPDDHLEQIKRWLKGDGRITFSNEPDVFYIGRVESVRKFEGATNEKVSTITFKCQPWAYLFSGDNKITIDTKNTKIINNEEESKPLIKAFGSGKIDLFINSNKYVLDIVNEITIDSELMESWEDNNAKPIKGGFPSLKSGENNIYWDGIVSKIEVIPRWRK